MLSILKESKIILWVFLFLSITIGFGIYLQVLNAPFQFDDKVYIVDNPLIRNMNDFPVIFNALSGHRRFVSLYSFALNYHFSNLDTYSYHLVNVLIHIANALLIFILTKLLFRTQNKSNDNVIWISILASMIFLTHPIQTQAVSYITQRIASLATMFYLLGICCYIQARLRNNLIWFIGFILTAILGMFSKEIVFSLPLVIVLLEILLIKQSTKRGLINSKMFLGVLTAGLLLVVPFMYSFNIAKFFNVNVASESHLGDVITTKTYALTQPRVILQYLRLVFFPIQQNLDYDFALSRSWLDLFTVLAGALIVTIIVWAFFTKKRNAFISFLVLSFFTMLSVESSILPIRNIIFEHRMYLPMSMFSILISFLLFHVFSNKSKFIGVACIIALCLSYLTVQRNKVWSNNQNLWQDVIRKSPDKARGYQNLGVIYLEKNQNQLAIEYFSKAIEFNPTYSTAYMNRADALVNINDFDQAIVDYDQAIKTNNSNAQAYKSRGRWHLLKNNLDQALEDYNQALKYFPYFSDAYAQRGIIFGMKGQYDQALEDLNKALVLDSANASIYSNRGVVYAAQGEFVKAIIDYNQAIKINPERMDAYYNRSIAYQSIGESEKSAKDLQKVKELQVNMNLINQP